MRNLLYHRGIDDGYTTYVTDYVIGTLFVVCAIFLGAMSIKVYFFREKEQQRKKRITNKHSFFDNRTDFVQAVTEVSNIKQDQPSSTVNHSTNVFYLKIALTFMFFACGVMHLLGGLTHMMVQQVPMTSLTNDFTHDDLLYTRDQLLEDIENRILLSSFYVVWQVANVFGGFVAGLIIVSVHLTLTCDYISKPRNLRRFSRAFSKTSARSRSSTVNSAAVCSPKRRNKVSKCVLINVAALHHICFKYALNTVAVLMVTSNFLYHAWNIYSYNSAIQTRLLNLEKLKDLLSAGINVLDRHFSTREEQLNLDSLWGMDATIPILGLSIFVYAVMATCSVLAHLKETHSKISNAVKQNNIFGEENYQSTIEESINIFPDQNRFSGNLRSSICGRFLRKISTLSPFYTKSFRCIGAWFMLSSGLVQFSFSSQCSSDGAYESGLCPFPDWFNHNSVYHVMLGVGMLFWFIGESFHFCAEIFYLKSLVFKNSATV